MRISIVDKEIRHVLDLTSEELVKLIQYKISAGRYSSKFDIVSPVLVCAGSKKFQVTLVGAKSVEEYDNAYYQRSRQVFEIDQPPPTRKNIGAIDFIATGELTAEMVQPIVEADYLLFIARLKNKPSYAIISNYRIYFDKKSPVGDTNGKVLLEMVIKSVKPIEELLKAQISEEQWYEVYVIGKSEDFFLGEGKLLDDLVGLIGLKRLEREDDFALRRRVIKYLKRVVEEPPISEEEISEMLERTQQELEVDRKIDAAKKKKEKENKKEEDKK